MTATPDSLSIGEVARRTGRRASAIRYYEQIGLLPQPERIGGRRMYDPGVVRTLAMIETAQCAGLGLDEIGSMLAGSAELRAVAARRLPAMAAEIERAERAREWLECATQCECPDLDDCPLFDD